MVFGFSGNTVEAAELFLVAVEDDLVGGQLFGGELVTVERCGGVEVEKEDEASFFESEDFFLVVAPEVDRGVGGQKFVFLDEFQHVFVESSEVFVSEMVGVGEAPMSHSMMEAPVVAFPREINPFGMAEFVAHEVEVALSRECERDETNHFVESDGSVDLEVRGEDGHVAVHLLVGKPEHDGFVTDQGLIVRLAVADASF